ncbi:MAG: DeoR/GlpR transcriptional regulator [Planctomycetes bacterium]|nr:DeoR/GlpR transcriptional regulator [Planctomycetota bacterium]
MSQLAEERQKMIVERAGLNGGCVISELALEFGVSEMTIRRDLKHMEDRGLLIRVHGGAIATGAKFDQRLTANASAKGKAAKKLAEFIPTSGTIYLDGSTTMLNLIGSMKNCIDLQVVTNHTETFRRLSAHHGVEALLLGGRLDKRTDNLVGSLALRSIQALAFDAAFFSAWGLDDRIGPTEITLEDAEVKDLVASRSRKIYLAVDESQLGVTASASWHAEKEISVLATDLQPDDKRLQPYGKLFDKIV